MFVNFWRLGIRKNWVLWHFQIRMLYMRWVHTLVIRHHLWTLQPARKKHLLSPGLSRKNWKKYESNVYRILVFLSIQSWALHVRIVTSNGRLVVVSTGCIHSLPHDLIMFQCRSDKCHLAPVLRAVQRSRLKLSTANAKRAFLRGSHAQSLPSFPCARPG